MQVLDDPEDPDDRLLESGIVNLHGEIDNHIAQRVITRMLHVFQNSQVDITLAIDSSGGSIIDGFAIFDIMRLCRPREATVCTGQAAGIALLLLTAGCIGKRRAISTSSLQLVPIHGERHYSAATMHQLERMRKNIVANFVDRSSFTAEMIRKSMDSWRDFSPEEAVVGGFIDGIIATREWIPQ